jgi:uncharacterized RDD family membrane protein YckC
MLRMFCSTCGQSNPDTVNFCSQCGAQLIGVAAPAAPAAVYAGFWRRVAATFIDGLVLMILGWGASIVLEGWVTQLLGGVVLDWIYFAVLESSEKRATVGKMALGAVVTDLAGRRISFARATARFFGKFVSAFILGIGFIMAGLTEKKQGLHDMMAGTLVVMA